MSVSYRHHYKNNRQYMFIEPLPLCHYKATIKARGVYIAVTGRTHAEAIQRALSEYFKPF